MTFTTNSAWAAQMNLQRRCLPKPVLLLDAEGARWRFDVRWREVDGGIQQYVHVTRNGEYYPSSDVGAFSLLCTLIDAQPKHHCEVLCDDPRGCSTCNPWGT